MYLEATVDADHRIHPVGISDMISTENLIGYTGFMERNVAATGGQQSPLLGRRLALGDGNVAIPQALKQTRLTPSSPETRVITRRISPGGSDGSS
jgi:hypothetical protein